MGTTIGKETFEYNVDRIVQALQQTGYEESEALDTYKKEGTTLEFTLVTSGTIRGKLLWVSNQSFGIRTDPDQNVILYKHAIAFIQEQAI